MERGLQIARCCATHDTGQQKGAFQELSRDVREALKPAALGPGCWLMAGVEQLHTERSQRRPIESGVQETKTTTTGQAGKMSFPNGPGARHPLHPHGSELAAHSWQGSFLR